MSFEDIMRTMLPQITTNGIDYESYINGGSTGYAPALNNPDRSDYNDTTPLRLPNIHGGVDIYYYQMVNNQPVSVGSTGYPNTDQNGDHPPVYAFVRGTVILAQKDANDNVIRDGGVSILDEYGYIHTIYHLCRIDVSVGQIIRNEDIEQQPRLQLGEMGRQYQGSSTGVPCHVHYEITTFSFPRKYQKIDPEAFWNNPPDTNNGFFTLTGTYKQGNEFFGTPNREILRGEGDGSSDDIRDGGTVLSNPDNDSLYGGGGSDIIDGGTGDDTLYGGNSYGANRYYTINIVTGVLDEFAPEDADTSADTLIGGMGGDYLNGGKGDDVLYGGVATISNGEVTYDAASDPDDSRDTLLGGAGDDKLYGGKGVDSMVGGIGDDTYEVDDSDDVIVEKDGEGTDLVESTVDYTLPDYVDNLTLMGEENINGTGNELPNVITGNTGNNILDGGAGTDTMIGGAGDDTYKVDDSADEIKENDGEGKELVESTATYTLPANVEDLTLMGKENINGTGNDLPNLIKGNTGNNSLDGGGGNDTLDGGGGNDQLDGGLGNDTLLGSSGNDMLDGGPGDDMIFGRGGTDTFTGGTGFDSYYVYNYTGGAQTVYNPHAVAHIDDEDKNGAVFTQTGQLRGGKQQEEGGNLYQDNSGNEYIWDGEDGSPLTIKCVTTSVIYVNNFYNGDLQIHLEPKEETNMASTSELVDNAEKRLSPIILDLDGDGIETTNINNGTFFDLDANGFAELTGWVSGDDGLLVMDRDKNGTIDSGRELFGNATLLNNGTKAVNGFQALAELDSNQDGTIDANDAAYTQLRIWQDIDGDGYSSADELKTLSELGIQSIRTGYTETITSITDASGNIISLSAVAGLDFNNDGKIDANDTTYSQLRIWQDINGDDYISADELKTLSELGIESINTEITNHITDADGKIIPLKALALLDRNYDGKIDAKDAVYTQLRIWNDINWDGNISADELTTLSGLVIDYVNKGSVEDNTYIIDASGNTIRQYGTFTRTDGTTGSAADVWFNADKMYTVATEWLNVSEEIAALPDLAGTGTVYSLHQAMVHDESGHLQDLVEQFAAETNVNVRHTLITQILYAWTGVENIDPLSRASHPIYGNAIGDARKLATLEALVGESYLGTWCGITRDPNPHGPASKILLRAFDELAGRIYTQLMAQTHFKDLLDSITKTWNNDTNQFDWDVSATRDALQVLYNANPDNRFLAMSEFADILKLDGAGGQQALQTLCAQGNLTSSDEFLRLLAMLGPNPKVGDAGNNTLQGTNYADALYGMIGNDTLYGNAGDDYLNGGTGNDWLHGGAGNDTLDGADGNDILFGGSPRGGAGNDTYLFGRGSGQDSINDYDKTAGNVDTILLDHDISPADITLRRDYDDLVLSINDTSDTITVNRWFYDESGPYQVEQIQFSDGTLWDAATIKQMMLQGTSGADLIKGYSTADTISGLEGNDQLYAYAGNDILDGGAGNDQLYGGDGNDVLDGGDGGDQLYGQTGNDVLNGGEGIDYLSGDAGDDTLDGGAGNDYLFGAIAYSSYYKGQWYGWKYASGNDTYLFGRGSGQDTIVDCDQTAGNVDTILLNPDISPSDVTLRYNGNDLVLTINDTTDKLTVRYWFADELGIYRVEQIQFGDGTVWDSATIEQMVFLGTSGDDMLIGFPKADVISGLEGNDQLYGRAGDDTLDGGAGNDTLAGEAGNDVLRGGEGIDSLSGGTGDDTLDSGTGDDYLSGGSGSYDFWNSSVSNGNDTYLFGRGSGHDTIVDYDKTAGNVDTILLNPDISPAEITLHRIGNDLVLSINDTSDTITVSNWFADESGIYQVEHVQFGDGTVWDADTIKQMVLLGTSGDDVLLGYPTADIIRGFDGNDRLYGRGGDDTLDGGAGNDQLYGDDDNDILDGGAGYDTLYGEAGNDILQGGEWDDVLYGGQGDDVLDGGADYGYDTLYGEAGNDTYIFGHDYWSDTIIDTDNTPGNIDTILLNSDITPADVMLRRYYDDLILSLNDTGESITVSNWFLNESTEYQVEQIQFADGTIWDVPAIKLLVLQGTPYDDILIGYSSADVLDGGTGNDTLIGNKGDDTYMFGRGYGQDRIMDVDDTPGNMDTVQLTPDVLPEDVSLAWGVDGLHLTIDDTSDSLLLSSWFVSDKYKIEQIQFADGTVWDAATMQSMTSAPAYIETQLIGTPYNDVLIGNSTADFIQGLDSNDRLYGADGNDIIVGDGGNDALYGGNGDDILDGGAGKDYLYGGSNTDYSNTSISNGNDTYMFGFGSGQDTIIDYDKTPGNCDTIIILNADIAPADVTLKRRDDDLVLSLNSTADSVTVKYWFINDASKIECIQFADGTVWDVQDIKQLMLQGTSYSDTLFGYSTPDTIMGHDGYDTLYGRGGDDVIYGGGSIDEINGDDGNDTLIGGDGNNNNGSSKDYDTLYGGAGDDVLDGGAGKDTLYGGSKGNWYLQSGTNGNDTYLFGNGSGEDLIYDYDRTPGNRDTILVRDGVSPADVTLSRIDDDLVLTDGSDTMTVSKWFSDDACKVEHIKFADGTIWDVPYINQHISVVGGHNHTPGTVTGTAGNDTLWGPAGDDVIAGLAGNDELRGGVYALRPSGEYFGVDLNDGNDTLLGADGNDTLYGGWGNDILDGGIGNDKLLGGDYFRGRFNWPLGKGLPSDSNGSDTYIFKRGYGQDIIYDCDATPGNLDTILLGDDILPSDVKLTDWHEYNNYGYDSGWFERDRLVLSIVDTTDTLEVDNWFNPSGDWKIERIQFADGTIWDLPAIQQMLLQGTPGDDYLFGDSSDDTLDGGAGNDRLIGGRGNDTYIFGRGYGQDVIINEDANIDSVDTILLKDDVLPSDVTLTRDYQNVYLKINNTSDQLRISYWYFMYYPGIDGVNERVDRIQFADGTIWDQTIIQNIVDTPTAGDDYLIGTPVNDLIDGGAGNDYIDGMDGDDALYGGAGNDYIKGMNGADALYGGAGDDTLYANVGGEGGGGAWDETLYGGSGNDELYVFRDYRINTATFYGGDGIDSLYGGDDFSYMDGGAGDDYIDGRYGENIYIVNRGSGFDSVNSKSIFTSGLGLDAVLFGDGITPDDLSVQIGEGGDGYGGGINGYGGSTQLAVGIGDNEGMLISATDSYGYGGSVSVADLNVRKFIFADGQELTLEQILARADRGIIGEQWGTGSDDSLLGSVANDQIYGGSGDDRIDGRDNEDYLYGDYGNDAISAGPGEDYVLGGYGDDVMAGVTGDDILSGQYGSDVYCFNRGDGHDYINNYPGISSGEIDTISFGVDINPADIAAYVNSYGDLVLTINGTDDDIALYWFDPATHEEYTDSGLARVQFIDEAGSSRIFDLAGIVSALKDSLLAADIDNSVSLFTDATSSFELTDTANQAGGDYAVAYAQTGDLFAVPTYYYGDYGDDVIDGGAGNDTIDAGDGNDSINAGAGDDVIIAGIGDDVINGGEGNDTLDGGGGNDTLTGGVGDDTYYYDIGYGTVTIDDLADASGGNRIVFGSTITPDDLSLGVEEGYLIITVGNNTEDRIRLTNFNPDDAYGPHAVDRYEFADGQVLTYGQLMDKGFDFIGTEGEDVMIGSSAFDRINALGGDDILVGGKGNDVLDGGSGNDVYFFNPGDGIDTIIDQAFVTAGNVVQFGEGITLSDLTLTAEQNTLIIQVGEGDDALRLEGFNPDDVFGNRAVDVFRFADGTTVDYDQLLTMKGFSFTGTTGDDALTGTSIHDVFQGGVGSDTLAGGMGSDAYVFNPGDGVDTIDDTASPDQPNTLIFGAGITPADIHLDHDLANGELIINIGTTGDSVRLKNFDAADPYGPHAVEYYQFADGQVLTYSQLIDLGFDINGTAGDDDLIGTATVDRISGDAGNDTLSGGAGNDAVAGGLGDDTYLFNLGDGVDVIDDVAMASAGNTLEFGPDIGFCDISLAYSGDTMIMYVGDNGDEVHLRGFDPTAADTGPRAVQNFRFADGTTISYEELLGKTFVVQGDVGDDYLIGTNVGDRLSGFEGNDTLVGGAGYDALLGRTGDDLLIGGPGSDLYVFYLGDGVDTIDDMFALAEGNLILFGDDITPADLTFVQHDGMLTIYYGDNGDAVTLLNYDQDGIDGSPVIRTLEFADGDQMRLLNRPPIIVTPIPDQTTLEDAAFNFAVQANSFEDPDLGDTLAYRATLADGTALPAWLSFDPATMTFSGTPTNDDVGTLSLKVTATDTSEASVSDEFTVTIENVNDAPVVANPTDDQTILEDAVFSFTVPADTFADVDLGDSLTYDATLADGTALPTWLTFDPVTMTFSGTPANEDVGTLSLKVTATDTTGASVSDEFDVTIENVNDAPVVANPIADQTTLEDELFSFTVPADTFADVDVGDSLICDATLADGTALPAWLTFDPWTMTFSGTPANEDVGILNLKVTATDTAGANISDEFTIMVESNVVVTYGTNHWDFICTGRNNDLIYALSGSDLVYSGGGNDTIYGGNGRDWILGGAGDDALYGENGKDFLYGGTGDDTLDGGNGADIMFGGAGDDTYIVDNPHDVVSEFCHKSTGTDTVQSSVTYTLDHNVENLTLTGTAAINGTGNALDNVLIGNSGNNKLTGGAGNDMLDGGAGNDCLIGGTGDDIYAFMRGDGHDTITDYDTTAGNSDTVKFGSGINPLDVILVNNGKDLDIQINDSLDLLTVRNQNSCSANQVEVFEAGDGSRLLSSQVDLLIQAMAVFSAENGGMSWMELIDQKPAEVQQILAQHWQAPK